MAESQGNKKVMVPQGWQNSDSSFNIIELEELL